LFQSESDFVVDAFSEVDEQLRADRLRSLVQRGVPVFIAILVLTILAVVAVWGVQQFRSSQSAKASQAYNDALDVESKGDNVKAFDQFGAVAKGSGAYVALALMQQGGIRMDQDKPAEAAQLFDKAAAASKTPIIADIASLKAAYALLDTAPLAQMTDRLTPLTKPDRPYHVQAREALAMAKLAAGKAADAKGDLVALGLLADTPDSVRQRSQAIIALIDSGTGVKLKSLEEQAKTATPIPIQPPAQAGPQGAPGAPQDQAPQDQPEAPQ
jgi:hypothetical protein